MKKRPFFLGLIGVVLLAVLVLSFRLGMKFAGSEAQVEAGAELFPSGSFQERERVALYFADPEENCLTAEIREIPLPKEKSERAKKILETLLKGPANSLVSVIPEGTELLALYVEKETLVVDFSSELRGNHPGSSHTETLTLYAITNTLVLNSPGIRDVKVLIDGREENSLAGHVMIRYPLTANMTIVR